MYSSEKINNNQDYILHFESGPYYLKMNVFYLYTSVFSLIKKDSIKLPGWVSSGTFKILGALKLEEKKI